MHLDAVWAVLQQRAAQSNFGALLQDCFQQQGGDRSQFVARCDQLIEGLKAGNRLGLHVELVSAEQLQGALAAFAPTAHHGRGVILVNREWFAAASSQEIEAVLLEEIGHAFDQWLNPGADSVGDEGELFAALVNGAPLSAADRAVIRSEDDGGVVQLNGSPVAVEFAASRRSTAPAPASAPVAQAPVSNLTIQFANAYQGVIPTRGNANQPSQITLSGSNPATSIPGGVYFVQADTNQNGLFDAAVGNNIAGTLYVNGDSYQGTISRLYKDPGNVVGGFYFLQSKQPGSSAPKAFLLDLPGGRSFLVGSTYQLSSDNLCVASMICSIGRPAMGTSDSLRLKIRS
jgi:hypothetical protein